MNAATPSISATVAKLCATTKKSRRTRIIAPATHIAAYQAKSLHDADRKSEVPNSSTGPTFRSTAMPVTTNPHTVSGNNTVSRIDCIPSAAAIGLGVSLARSESVGTRPTSCWSRPLKCQAKIATAYATSEFPWINIVHVHFGSSAMDAADIHSAIHGLNWRACVIVTNQNPFASHVNSTRRITAVAASMTLPDSKRIPPAIDTSTNSLPRNPA